MVNNPIEPMIKHMEQMSDELLRHESNVTPMKVSQNEVLIDTTAFADDVTLYIDGDKLAELMDGNINGSLKIKKKENQMIVFNFDSTESVTLGRAIVEIYDEDGTLVDSGANYGASDTENGSPTNQWLDRLTRHIVWNLASVKEVDLEATSGIFLLPDENSVATVTGTSTGWIITDGYLTNPSGEWHFVYSELPDAGSEKTATVSISKVDAANSEQLTGATLELTGHFDVDSVTVLQEDGTKRNSLSVTADKMRYITNSQTVTISGLQNGVYTLTEITAPDGYEVAESITFEVVEGAVKNQTDNNIVMQDKAKTAETTTATTTTETTTTTTTEATTSTTTTEETTSTTEATTSTTTTEETTSTTEATTSTTTTEPPPPPRNTSTTETTTSTEATTTTTEATTTTTTQKSKVTISKTNLTTAKEIGGAILTIFDKNGNVVERWTSIEGESHVIEGVLIAGETYTLHESNAPNGYAYSEDITFTLNENGRVVDEDGNETIVTMKDDITRVTISKTDITGSEEIGGATLVLINEAGSIVEKWTSVEGESHTIEGKLNAGETRETNAPNGYAYSEDITFTVNEDGRVVDGDGKETAIIMQDDVTKVTISKTDITGDKEIGGATLVVLDKDGNEVDKWVSVEGESHTIEGKLNAGETYTLRETSAPTGYQYAEDITFTVNESGRVVDEDGNETVVVMKDADVITKVTISKTDITGDKEIGGAILTIFDKDGKVVERWTSVEGESHTIEGKLNAGETYTLRETNAPNGYAYSEDITFTVNENGRVVDENGNETTIVMKDDVTKRLLSPRLTSQATRKSAVQLWLFWIRTATRLTNGYLLKANLIQLKAN